MRKFACHAGHLIDPPGDGWCWLYAVIDNAQLVNELQDPQGLTAAQYLQRGKALVKLMKVGAVCRYR